MLTRGRAHDRPRAPHASGHDPAADVALTIARDGTARIEQAASTDPISFMYGLAHHFVPYRLADLRPGSGAWVHPRLILDRPYTVPVTGKPHATELADVSRLAWGDWSEPTHLMWTSGDELDVRIPWHDLTFSDPSSNRIWVTHANGTMTSEHAGPIGIAVEDGGVLTSTRGFGWKPWNTVTWHERRKVGWSAIRAAIAAVSRKP